jgi:D-lactate dehydrogenase
VNLAAGAKIICIFVNDIANDAQIISQLSSLEVSMIALRCAGFNNVDLKACDALGMSVARVPAYSPFSVAEHAVALLLAINRKIHTAFARNKTGNFALSGLVGFDLHGKTVGVVGTGKIGVCFIKIMLGFGCNVLAYDVYPSEEVATMKGVKYVPLSELLPQSDVISIHCPLLPSTQHIINSDTISQMKKGVILINTSRGGLIKTVDLIKGLKSGQIGGAGLDVYEDEREYFFEDRSQEVMKDDVLARLMTFNNVLITAHQAFLTEEALSAIARTTAGNIQEFMQGKKMKKLTNSVNSV